MVMFLPIFGRNYGVVLNHSKMILGWDMILIRGKLVSVVEPVVSTSLCFYQQTLT